MKKGIIVVNAYSDNADYLYQADRLREEFALRGVCVEVVKNYCGIAGIQKNGKIALQEKGDFAVFLDKDKYVMRLLEKAGVRLFNSAQAIEVCDDKMLTHIALSQAGISMPAVLPAPLCYTPEGKIGKAYCDNVIAALGLPVVVKHSYGSLGKEVFLADDAEALRAYAQQLRFTPHFYQQFIEESRGRDLRVVAVGGKAIAAMTRTAEKGEFRSNAARGGRCETFPLNAELCSLAEKIAATLGLDYCGMDFLFGKEGLLLCEVNSNAYFKALERTTGVNVAAAYAEHILNAIG